MFFGEVDKYRGICYTIGIMGVEYNGKGKGGENMKCFKRKLSWRLYLFCLTTGLIPTMVLMVIAVLTDARQLLLPGAVLLVFSLSAAILFARRFTKRIIRLQHKAKRALKADFDIVEPIECRDELGELESALYEMVTALDTMFDNQYRTLEKEHEQKMHNEQLLRARTQAEIEALRYQINPHYLFNTMESIRMHLYLKGDRETARIIYLFSESFRKMLEAEGADYTLFDELQTIENYLKVQKYRLGDRFTSEVTVDENLPNCRIPKLLLQPLVENAFFHGIELSENPGVLQVTVRRRTDKLYMTVKDNGVGMTKEKMEELRRNLQEDEKSSAPRVGLRNVVQRLRLQYGESYRFEIESDPGTGTKVTIVIPYETVGG